MVKISASRTVGVARKQARPDKEKGEGRQPKAWKPAVILQGGPRDGWSYFVDDMIAYAKLPDPTHWVHDYHATTRERLHPENNNAMSKIWEYRPRGRR